MNKRTRLNFPIVVQNFIQNPDELKNMAIMDAMNRSVISERLVNKPVCGTGYNESTFRILRMCYNNYDLINLEAILIKLKKLKLNKQKDFDYVVSLHKYAVLLLF